MYDSRIMMLKHILVQHYLIIRHNCNNLRHLVGTPADSSYDQDARKFCNCITRISSNINFANSYDLHLQRAFV